MVYAVPEIHNIIMDFWLSATTKKKKKTPNSWISEKKIGGSASEFRKDCMFNTTSHYKIVAVYISYNV